MTVEGPKAAKGQEIQSAADLGHRVFDPHRGGRRRRGPPTPGEDAVRENLRVFADDGKVVSAAVMSYREVVLLGTRHLVCCYGGVCTDPDYRGRGLATRLLADARDKAVRDGADIVLISGRRGLYRRQGYIQVGSFYVCTIQRNRLPIGTNTQYVLRPPQAEDMPALLEAQLAEPARFVRTPPEFARLLQRKHLLMARGETQVVCPKGSDKPVAFVAYQIGGAPWEHKAETAITVVEMGGPRWAIVQALGTLLDERGLDEMELHYAECDAEISQMARSFGWPCEPRGFRGTVGVIDPARFWQACTPLFRERLAQDEFGRLALSADGSVRITYGDEELVLDGMSAFTMLVFLHPHRRGELELGLGPDSELAQVLDRLFPLPLVNYGLNYY